MRLGDLLLLVLICLTWAFNNVLSKIVVDAWAVPPLFYAALRFAVEGGLNRWVAPQVRGL